MTDFYLKIYEFVKTIPAGKVVNYGYISFMCGNPRASRAVGAALHHNPKPMLDSCVNDPSLIPCHRVVFADGSLANNFAFGGASIQRQLLKIEGVKFDKSNKVKREFFTENPRLP